MIRSRMLGGDSMIGPKKAAARALDVGQRIYASVLTRSGAVDYAVPPNSLMRTTSGRSIRHYYQSGMNCYLPLVTAARMVGVPVDEPIAILDFGCGVGRQLLHFSRRLPAPRYHACDVNGASIRFIRDAYPDVRSEVSSYFPPLPYADATFDMVYSVSIFSHLPPSDHMPWLAELGRICRPGAHLFLTIEGKMALAQMARAGWTTNINEEMDRLHREGILYREYVDLPSQKVHEGVTRSGAKYLGIAGSYGNTVMSPSHVKSNWSGAGLEVVSVVEGVIDNRQDIVILRRS